MTQRTITKDDMTELAKRSGVIRALLQSAAAMSEHAGIPPAGIAACFLTAAVALLADRRVCDRQTGELLMSDAQALFDLPDDQHTPRSN